MRFARWISSLLLIVVASILAASAAQAGDRDESASQSGSGSGNVIGYQPIPNSMLPTSGQRSQPQMLASQPMAPATQMQRTYTEQPTPQLENRAPGTGYDYTIWLVGQGPYTLGRDDVIQVDVRNQPEFSGQYIVGPEGEIQYSHLGDIPVLGMTKGEVQQVLEKMLARFIRVPQVTVTIVAFNSKAVYVIGELNRPGKYIMRGDTIKLREAIVAAGLPTRFAALWRTHIVKPDINDPKVRKVNLKKILYSGKLYEDLDLYPGEIVVVPSTVLHNVNLFLGDLLDPVTRGATAAAIGAGI